MRGLSMELLCCEMNHLITKQALSKYEKGLMQPKANVLESLCKVLKVPKAYFYAQEEVVIGGINFRSEARLAVQASEQMISTAQDKIERYLKIEDLLAIPSCFVNPINNLKIVSTENLEQAAERIRYKWNLGSTPIFSVYEMLESVGVKIIEFEAGTPDIIGFSTLINKSIPLIVINLTANHTTERKRFTALHELGHLLLNFDKEIEGRQIEKYCNLFAGAILCPSTVLYRELGYRRTSLTMNELISLKNRYGISIAAAVHRAKDLNIISERHYNEIFNHHIHENKMESGWGAYPIEEHTDRFERLLQRAIAEGVIDGEELAVMAHDSGESYIKTIKIL